MKSLSCLNNTSVLIIVQAYYYAITESTFLKFKNVIENRLSFFI